jgi:hypothetical protein
VEVQDMAGKKMVTKEPAEPSTGDLIRRIEIAKGDAIETYRLRDEVLSKLKKLLALEGKEG